MKKIKSILQIPFNATLAIFGHGPHGLRLLVLIRKFRPDLNCKFFIDSFVFGVSDDDSYGIPTYGIDRLPDIDGGVDYVLIPAIDCPPPIPAQTEKMVHSIKSDSNIKCLVLTESVNAPPYPCFFMEAANIKDNARLAFLYDRKNKGSFDSLVSLLLSERPDLKVIASVPLDSLEVDVKSPEWRLVGELFESIDICIIMLPPPIRDSSINGGEIRSLRLPLCLLTPIDMFCIPGSYFTKEKTLAIEQVVKELPPIDAKIYKTRINQQAFNPLFPEQRPYICGLYPNRAPEYLDYIARDKIKTVFHAGSYDGGTCVEFIAHLPNLEDIYAFDFNDDFLRSGPNFHKILSSNVKFHFTAAGLDKTSGDKSFTGDAYARCLQSESGIARKVKTIAIDDFVENNKIKVDFIALDIEGGELDALKGALTTIESQRPQMSISIYHRKTDIVEIPIFMQEHLKDYNFRIGQYARFSLAEMDIYAIPKELCDNE